MTFRQEVEQHFPAPGVYERILGRVYLYARGGAMVVAVKGVADDWAAYFMVLPPELDRDSLHTAHEVGSRGSKLREHEARGFFPNIELPYRR